MVKYMQFLSQGLWSLEPQQMGVFRMGFLFAYLFVCTWEVKGKMWKRQQCEVVTKDFMIHVWKPVETLRPEVNPFFKEIWLLETPVQENPETIQ